jgi:hypothetical protein
MGPGAKLAFALATRDVYLGAAVTALLAAVLAGFGGGEQE